MTIEILYPELGCLYGDSGNVLYLKQCFSGRNDVTFIETHVDDTPYFASSRPDLLLMGPSTEKNQQLIIRLLTPYRDALKACIEDDVPMLLTGNAGEVLFSSIHTWDDATIPALDLLPFTAERSHYERYNGLVLGQFPSDEASIEMVGFMSQFDFWKGDNSTCPFLRVERGIGLDPQSELEGIRSHNAFITTLLGPILILNPDFTRCLLDLAGASDVPLAFETALREAAAKRREEFHDPRVSFKV